MAGPKTALLLQAFARVGMAGAELAASRQMANTGQPAPKRKTAGCTPCQAAAKVAAARERVRNGR